MGVGGIGLEWIGQECVQALAEIIKNVCGTGCDWSRISVGTGGVGQEGL